MRRSVSGTSNPIIIALDGMTPEAALALVDEFIAAGFYNHGWWGVKLEDPMLNNNVVLSKMISKGIRIFSDPKLFIALPTRVAPAISYYTPAHIISICSFVAIDVMREAVSCAHPWQLAALLVPTPFDNATSQSKFGRDLEGATYEFALHAKLANVPTLICLPRELPILTRYKEFADMLRITPAIRPEWYSGRDDEYHQETMTPLAALEAGADFLVIGSPITQSQENPVTSLERIIKETKDFTK